MARFLLILTAIWPLLSSGQSPYRISYQRSPIISDRAGNPVSSSTWYFPASRFIDSTQHRVRVPEERVNDAMRTDPRYDILPDGQVLGRQIVTRVDTFKLNWFSYYLYKLQEPVLFNYPLGKEVYRLTWIRSFHPPVVVRMEKERNRVRLTTKILSRMPRLPGYRFIDIDGTVHLADTLAIIPFRQNKVKTVSKVAYDKYVDLLSNSRALFISPLGFRDVLGGDGSEWILETHRPDGYYFIVRWSPRQRETLRTLGDYLLDLSDAKEEKRY